MGAQSDRIGANLVKGIEAACKAAALEIDRELRRTTPIDTGNARRNWIPSVGAPHEGAGGDAGHAAGVAQVVGYKLTQGPLWVSNATPYINRLNYGSSKQAPAGFVERAVDVAFQRVQQKFAAQNIDVSSLRTDFQRIAGAEGANNLASAYSPFGGDE